MLNRLVFGVEWVTLFITMACLADLVYAGLRLNFWPRRVGPRRVLAALLYVVLLTGCVLGLGFHSQAGRQDGFGFWQFLFVGIGAFGLCLSTEVWYAEVPKLCRRR